MKIFLLILFGMQLLSLILIFNDVYICFNSSQICKSFVHDFFNHAGWGIVYILFSWQVWSLYKEK